MSTRTPWGPSQSSRTYTRGLTFHATAGHGGFHVSPTLVARMPAPFRKADGWYEEDAEAAMVILSFPAFFTSDQYDSALCTLKNWFPEEARAAGIPVSEEESSVLQQQAFLVRHAHDYVVLTAWGDWHQDVPQGQVGVLARVPATGEEGFFLVPKEEYKAGRFVIDPQRHLRCAPLR